MNINVDSVIIEIDGEIYKSNGPATMFFETHTDTKRIVDETDDVFTKLVPTRFKCEMEFIPSIKSDNFKGFFDKLQK